MRDFSAFRKFGKKSDKNKTKFFSEKFCPVVCTDFRIFQYTRICVRKELRATLARSLCSLRSLRSPQKLSYFERVVVLNFNFYIVAMFQKTVVRGTRLKTTEGAILYLTPLLSDRSDFLQIWRFWPLLTFLKISCSYHTRFLKKTALKTAEKFKNKLFSRMVHFETINDMNKTLLFCKSGSA